MNSQIISKYILYNHIQGKDESLPLAYYLSWLSGLYKTIASPAEATPLRRGPSQLLYSFDPKLTTVLTQHDKLVPFVIKLYVN